MRVLSVIFFVLFCTPASGLFAADQEWVKITTRELPLPDENGVVTPGLFDWDRQHFVTFTNDGKPVELGLPNEGRDKDGKTRPPITGALANGFLWLDINANGIKEDSEVIRVPDEHPAGPYTFRTSYDDGTEALLSFKVFQGIKEFQYKFIRCTARQFEFNKHKFVLLDDNGNGRYDDYGVDALAMAGEPVSLLSRLIQLNGQWYELLVHPAGITVELRAVDKPALGQVDMVVNFKIPQKSENTRIQTVIIANKEYAFSFDAQHPRREIPVGAYDFSFGLLERANEQVYMKHGERTSFSLEAGKGVAPLWGGPITGTLGVTDDGVKLMVPKPSFTGVGSEVYVPADYSKFNLHATYGTIWKDKQLNNMERYDGMGDKRYQAGLGGDLLPAIFTHHKDDLLQFGVELKSGILGPVSVQERHTYVKKLEVKKPKEALKDL